MANEHEPGVPEEDKTLGFMDRNEVSRRDLWKALSLGGLAVLASGGSSQQVSAQSLSLGNEPIQQFGDPSVWEIDPTDELLEFRHVPTDTIWRLNDDGTVEGFGVSTFGYDSIVSTSTDYTASPGELVLADASGGGFTITLPSTHSSLDVVGVKKTDSGSSQVDLRRGGNELVDGDAGIGLDAENEFVGVVSDGANWYSFHQVGDFTTLTGITTIDDFEDNNLSEYTGDNNNFTIQTTTVLQGTRTLKSESDTTVNQIISTSGLPAYPSQDDTIAYQTQLGTTDAKSQFLWFVQDANNYYLIELEVGTDTLTIFKRNGGSFTQLAETTTVGLAIDTEYRVEVTPQSNNTHIIEVYDQSTDTLVDTVQTTDSDFTNGGIGWRASNPDGEPPGETYFDDLRLI